MDRARAGRSSSSTRAAVCSSTPASTARRSRIRSGASARAARAGFGMRSRPGDDVVSQLALARPPARRRHLRRQLALPLRPLRRQRVLPAVDVPRPADELEAARDPAVLAQKRYTPSAQDFDHPLAYRPIDGEHDVFGDGTVVLIPTYGHTPAISPSRCEPARAAISCWPPTPATRARTWIGISLPSVLWDAAEMACSLARLAGPSGPPGRHVIFGHDPAQWRTCRARPSHSRLPDMARRGPGRR